MHVEPRSQILYTPTILRVFVSSGGFY